MKCARCQDEVILTVMSRFNLEIICLDCEDIEKKHPDYEYAKEKENEEVRKGNMNFRGVGWPGEEGRIERRKKIQYEIPPGTREVVCKGEKCLRGIFWIETKNGKRMPVDPDGTPHWATCPDAGRFTKGARA